MPRKDRYIVPGLPHHLFQRGNNKQNVFRDLKDKRFFIEKIKREAEENSVRIGAYCLMTNHFHFLLFPDTKENFIRFVKSASQKYSQYFNRKYKRTGKVWENRYKLNIVDPEACWVLARYVERNPIRAGLVERVEDYEYSSAAVHLCGGIDDLVTEDILKGKRKEYIEFFHEKDADNKNELDRIRDVIQRQKAIGSKDFLGRLRERFGMDFNIRMRGRPRKKKK
jgi:putative transposase